MDNRFTFKDLVFATLIVVVIGAVLWSSFQFSYQERRLNDVRSDLKTLAESTKRQNDLMEKLLSGGIAINNGTGQPGTKPGRQVTRVTNADGSVTVSSPQIMMPSRDPRGLPDFSMGDWMVDNLGDEPSTITPYLTRTLSESAAMDIILEGLVARDRDTMEYLPFIAESYTISADKLTYRFVIRKGITFSDGVPLTADDVVFTYQTIMNKDVEAEPMRSYVERITSCKKIDDQTVEMKFDEPYFLALSICGFGIMPKHVYKFDKAEDFNNNKLVCVGSGPYKYERWDRGQKLVLTRNDRYWGPKPIFDKYVFVFITNPQAAFQSFQNGDIDQFTPDPEQWEQFSSSEDFKKKFISYKYPPPALSYRYIGWNAAKPIFKDKQTRQALTMLIDRASIIKTIQRGMAVELSGPFNPTSPQYDSSIAPWPYDPAAAKKLLAAAGWKAGGDGVLTREGARFEFELAIPAKSPQYEKIAAYIKEQFEKAGIRMSIGPYEFAVLSQRLDDRNYDAAMLGWGGSAGEDDPTQIWHSRSIAGKGSNYVSFRNEKADALLDQAVKELDTEKRMALWHQFHAIVHEEQPYTFMSCGITRAFINGRFRNTEPDKLGLDTTVWYTPQAKRKY